MNVPDDLLYTVEHEWVKRLEGSRARIGVTDYAQDQLGDVVYVDLPEPGGTVAAGDLVAEIESTKSVGEVYAPFAGSISAVNAAISTNPALVNTSPYDDGWLVEIEGELVADGLLDAPAYREMTE